MNEKPMNKLGYIAKTTIKPVRKRFMPKVVSRQLTVCDALEKHFRSSISVFIPKLDPKHHTARAMLHVSNGGGSCLIRFKDPAVLADTLQEIVDTLRSDKWLDAWQRISDVSFELVNNNQIQLDEEVIDINAWKRSLEDTIDIELVQVKKEFDINTIKKNQ